VPTPFYHLSIAQEISEHPALNSKLRSLLQTHKGAFLLGNTAPDVQVLSGQKRKATHFFSVPIPKRWQFPWNRMLYEYPEFDHPADLSLDNAAFIAGYLCHLQADWIWVTDIFQPVFGPKQSWETFSKRIYLHNVLRAYLDVKVLDDLPADVPEKLCITRPEKWLPFIQDKLLVEWRDFLCDQLQPGERIRTVEVFASRQGIDPEEFHSMLHSEERMDKDIFTHLTRQELESFREVMITKNINLLDEYINNGSVTRAYSSSSSYNKRSV
jgi:hypothetical protein